MIDASACIRRHQAFVLAPALCPAPSTGHRAMLSVVYPPRSTLSCPRQPLVRAQCPLFPLAWGVALLGASIRSEIGRARMTYSRANVLCLFNVYTCAVN